MRETSTRRSTRTMLLVLLVVLLSYRNANAQRDERAISSEQKFQAAISAQVKAAAQKARVSLLPGVIAYAGGDGGFVVNTVVQGADRFGPQSSATGTDLLFVYIGANDLAVPEGYYKVRLTGTQAQFIASNGKVAATLPASVEEGTPAVRGKVKVKATGSWSKNGAVVDIEITFGESAAARAVTIPIPEKPGR